MKSNPQSGNQLILRENEASLNLPVFMQSWWLDIVCHGQWDVCISRNNEGQIDGLLTYYSKKIKGLLPSISQPPFTPFSGIYLATPPNVIHNHQLNKIQKAIIQNIISQLPPVIFYFQQLHFSISDWLPFYWNGFRQTTRYTYFIDKSQKIEAIWNSMKSNLRTNIRKASTHLIVEEQLDADCMYDLLVKTHLKNKKSFNFSKDLISTIINDASSRGQGKMWIARNKTGLAISAIFILYDANTAYFLFSGIDTREGNDGALSALIWEGIQFAINSNRNFDFEGTMLSKVEPTFRAFGGEQKHYFAIYKYKNWFWELINLLSGKRFING